MAKRIHRKINRTAADRARIEAVREKFQRERPTPAEVAASGDYEMTTQGEYLEAKVIAQKLKQARQNAKMSLADVANSTGMDVAAISRLENGVYPNMTINTLTRLLSAYGKRVVFQFEDDPAIAVK